MFSNSSFHPGAWLPLIILVLALILAFEIWMMVNAALNKKITDKAKAWWIVSMMLVHPLVAIIYFFTDYRKK